MRNTLCSTRSRGFTLVELLVTLSITALLLLAVAPLTGDWSRSAMTAGARMQLVQGFSVAKALALRNPEAVQHTDAANVRLPVAGLRVVRAGSEHRVLVCRGDPSHADCRMGGGAVVWQGGFPGAVGTVVAGTLVSVTASAAIAIDNRGEPIGATNFALTFGGAANDETGTLL